MPDPMTLADLFGLHDKAGRVSPATEYDLADPVAARHLRRHYETRKCLRCGKRARCTLLSKQSDVLGRPRWLDLCPADLAGLTRLVTGSGFPAADHLARLFEAWKTGDQARYDQLLAAA
jgi:hypothetical protein